LRAAGLYEPQSLEEWASVGLGQIDLPWLNPEESKTLQRSMSYFLLANELAKASKRSRSRVMKTGSYVLRKPLHWRLKNHYFKLPVELWLSMAQRWLTVRRSLLTGTALSRRMTEVH
jgi:hypothetical protein